MTARLNVNIDHVATVRQARRAPEPSVVAAAMICEQAGADGITVHLRGDRRHIQDADLFLLRQAVTTYLNVEMAATEEMMKIAIEVKPEAVSLVPENPGEITTEGGLNVRTNVAIVRAAVNRLREAGIMASLFIDPEPKSDRGRPRSECPTGRVVHRRVCRSHAGRVRDSRRKRGPRESRAAPFTRRRRARGPVWLTCCGRSWTDYAERRRRGGDQ